MSKRIILLILVVIALVTGGFLVFNRKNGDAGNLLVVQPGDFVQRVSVSGKVVAAKNVDLAFTETGRVARVAVRVGDRVLAGQSMVELDANTLQSELSAARATLDLKRAENKNVAVNLDQVRKEQDTLVLNAERKLFSSDLVAVPSSSGNTATAPVITGLYRGPAGRYKIIIRSESSTDQGRHELRTFELEKTAPVEILEDEATPLGQNGLFISFPEALDVYSDTIWYVTIPNTKSASYLEQYNGYEEALRTRDREINRAGEELVNNTEEATVAEAEIRQAEAEVERIETALVERTLHAPFAGIVTNVPAEVGAVLSANELAVSLIGDEFLQIESYVPEINLPLITVGDPVAVTLDAYGETISFAARVIFIDPAETVRDGVSTYRIKLAFISAEEDERIKPGMTANAVITTEERTGVISVPRGLVSDRQGQKFLIVKENDRLVERFVTLGNVSALGQVEILSGLSAGERVVLTVPPNE